MTRERSNGSRFRCNFPRRIARGGVHFRMKIFAVLALAAAFTGCTTSTPVAQNEPAPKTFGEKRVYSGHELESTGHTSVGRQLETLDPAIQSRGPGN